MSAANFEAFLARLYVDAEARSRFLADPHRETQNAGLAEEERAALLAIDRDGLEFAARSFSQKRTTQGVRRTMMKNLRPALIVSIIGVALCLGIYVGLTRYLKPAFGISPSAAQ